MAELKAYKCICCGKETMATKFASALKVKCEDCKAMNALPNEAILEEIKGEIDAKKRSKEISADNDAPEGKKKSVCTICGQDCYIGKFSSHKTAICDKCKGEGHGNNRRRSNDDDDREFIPFKIDLSKIDTDGLPRLDDAYISPLIIANPRLRSMKCPSCGHEMKIVKIMDSSPLNGLVIMYQCPDRECMMIMTISEQCKSLLSPVPQHVLYNYRGEEIHGFTDGLQDGKAKNTIEYLMKLLTDNGIEIPGNIDYKPILDKTYKNPHGLNQDLDEVNEVNKNDANG